MKFICVLRTAESHGFPPAALHEGMAAFSAEAHKAGVLADTAGMLPVATATRVGVTGGRLTVTDGAADQPMPLGAYAVYEVARRAEVVEWTRHFMDLHRRTWRGWEGESEIRQVFGPED